MKMCIYLSVSRKNILINIFWIHAELNQVYLQEVKNFNVRLLSETNLQHQAPSIFLYLLFCADRMDV